MRDPAVGRWLGGLSLLCAARPKTVVVAILALTLLAGLGMARLESEADLLKILPEDDPTTLAAQNASDHFRGFYDFVYVYYPIDPVACEAVRAERLPDDVARPPGTPPDARMAPQHCGNVTSEVYVRAMDELGAYFMERIPEARYSIDLAGIIKTVNWTNSAYADPEAGILGPVVSGEPGQAGRPVDGAYAMPGTDARGRFLYGAAWQGANAADDQINDVVSPEFKAGRTLLFFDSGASHASRVALGRAVYDTVDLYEADLTACQDEDDTTPCALAWPVFSSEEGLAVRGVAALDAHASDVTRDDIIRLAPIIITAIVLLLYVFFQDARVILVSAANLLVAFVWTAGLMGWLSIPFSALNMTIVPLILGVGIDYGIHLVSEYLEHKADGDRNREAFRKAGLRAGIAMAIATVTTIGGLLVMVASPSLLMGQLAVVSSIALLVTFVFTMTFVPALLTLTSRHREGRPHTGSRWVLGLARRVHRHRVATIAVVLLLTGGAVAGMQHLEPEPFGNPELNYPPGDRVRDDSEEIARLFFGGQTDTQSNFLVVEGDLTQPKAHAFLDAVELQLEKDRDEDGLGSFSVTSLTRVVRAWIGIRDGTPGAVANQFVLGNAPPEQADMHYPGTPEEIRATFDEIYASPFANFMTILLAEDGYGLATVTYDTRQDLTFAEVERVWAGTWDAVHAAQQEVYGTDQRAPDYDGPRVQPFGNNAFSHLFITKQQPWVNYTAYVAFGLVVAMIAVLTRDLRATLATASVMAVTGIWWLGVLPVLGIGLSVGLMLPMVFIMAIGSDDAIHLIWNMRHARERGKVYRFVGKAVFLTSLTTTVAFGLFSFQTDLLVRQTLLATAVAVATMWLATMLVVPLFYAPPPERAPAPGRWHRAPRPLPGAVREEPLVRVR